jgi:hypothetical protein
VAGCPEAGDAPSVSRKSERIKGEWKFAFDGLLEFIKRSALTCAVEAWSLEVCVIDRLPLRIGSCCITLTQTSPLSAALLCL